MSDWIKLHRKILNSAVASEDELLGLFTRVLLCVNFKPKWFKGFEVMPGQFVFAWRKLPERLYPNTDSRPSKNTITKRLNLLKSFGAVQIEPHPSQRFSILTVPNWERYQHQKGEKPPEGPYPNSGTVPGTVPGTVLGTERRREKKVKNVLSSTEVEGVEFEGFWKTYPVRTTPGGSRTKGDKKKSLTQWRRLKRTEKDLARAGAIAYARSGQIPKDCERWLRDKQWETWLNAESEQANPLLAEDDHIYAGDDAPPKLKLTEVRR